MMTNSYVSLDVFKDEGVLNIAGDGEDARLLSLLESVSRMVDRYCNRHFYVLEATRRFDGDGGGRLLVPDLVSIGEGGLKTDDDLDGVFETAWDAWEVRAAAVERRSCVARERWVAAVHVRGGLRQGGECSADGLQRAGRRCRSPGNGVGGVT